MNDVQSSSCDPPGDRPVG